MKSSLSDKELEIMAEKVLQEWLDRYTAPSQSVPKPIIEHRRILNELHMQYTTKNADYGNSFSVTYAHYGMIAPTVRMWDKLHRIETLSKQAAKVDDESLRDSLMDLANYAILTIMELDARKPS